MSMFISLITSPASSLLPSPSLPQGTVVDISWKPHKVASKGEIWITTRPFVFLFLTGEKKYNKRMHWQQTHGLSPFLWLLNRSCGHTDTPAHHPESRRANKGGKAPWPLVLFSFQLSPRPSQLGSGKNMPWPWQVLMDSFCLIHSLQDAGLYVSSSLRIKALFPLSNNGLTRNSRLCHLWRDTN